MSAVAVDDDNFIVLMVGEEDGTKDNDLLVEVSGPDYVNVESLNDSDDNKKAPSELFKSSSDEQEDNSEDKYLEEDYDVEYLEEDDEGSKDSDEEYKVKKTIRTRKKGRPKKNTPREAPMPKQRVYRNDEIRLKNGQRRKVVSFVAELRKENPKLANDPQQMVDHLESLMRKLRPPDPPEGYYNVVINGEYTEYECSFCGKLSESEYWAGRHYQTSHGEFYLKCFACGMQYTNNSNLYKHEKRCPAPDIDVVLKARGRFLGRRGRSRPYATRHKYIHPHPPTAPRAKQRYYCEMCPSSFTHMFNLIAHENAHRGLRPCQCDHCPANFTSTVKLNRHIRMAHSGQVFICDVCGAEFNLKNSLVKHLERHQGFRRFRCEYCPMSFSEKTAFITHTNKVHLNLPAPHACQFCHKRYSRMRTAREHMRVKHGYTVITRKMIQQVLPTIGNQPVDSKQDTNKEPIEIKIVCNNPEPNQEPQDDDGEVESLQPPEIIKKEIVPETTIVPLKEYIELDLTDNVTDGSFISHVTVEDAVMTETITPKSENKNRTDETLSNKSSDNNNLNKIPQIKEETFETEIVYSDVEYLEDEIDDECDRIQDSQSGSNRDYKVSGEGEKHAAIALAKQSGKKVVKNAGNSKGVRNKKQAPMTSTDDDEESDDDFDKMVKEKKGKRGKKIKPTQIKFESKPNTIPVDVNPIVDDFDTIIDLKSKRNREKKSAQIVPNKNLADDKVYKVAKDIKSTLRKPPKELKKCAPEKEKESGNLKDVNVEAIKVEVKEEDVKDWKEFQKHQVVTEFLEYVKSGNVPKRIPASVPILRKKSKEEHWMTIQASEWLKKIRDGHKPENDADCKVVDVTKIAEGSGTVDRPRTRRQTKLKTVTKKRPVPFVKIVHKKK